MAHARSRASGRSSMQHGSSFCLIDDWISDNADLVRGLAALRSLGTEAALALETIDCIPTIKRASLSWRLVRHFTVGTAERSALPIALREAADLAFGFDESVPNAGTAWIVTYRALRVAERAGG